MRPPTRCNLGRYIPIGTTIVSEREVRHGCCEELAESPGNAHVGLARQRAHPFVGDSRCIGVIGPWGRGVEFPAGRIRAGTTGVGLRLHQRPGWRRPYL